MDGYELTSEPFFFNTGTGVKKFRGKSKACNQPILAKCHDIQFVTKPQFIEDFTKVMNAGLAQARVDHRHACKILDFGLDVNTERNLFSVFHVLEALPKDVEQNIKERKQDHRIPSEDEVKMLLLQIAQALAYAHENQIAHRDIKPNNIFMEREGFYKIGDFGSYFEKKGGRAAVTSLGIGTLPYMSPGQRGLIGGDVESYDAYKSDVFSLGLTALTFATVTLLEKPWPLETFGQKVEATMQGVHCSDPLKNLIRSMLAFDEGARPNMQYVCDVLDPPKLPPTVAAARNEEPVYQPTQPEESKLPPTVTAGRNEPPKPAVRPEESISPPYPTPPPQTQLVRLTESTIEFLDFQREVVP